MQTCSMRALYVLWHMCSKCDVLRVYFIVSVSAAVLYQVPVSLRLSSESSLPFSQLDSCVTCCHAEQSGITIHCHGIQPQPEHTMHLYGFKC